MSPSKGGCAIVLAAILPMVASAQDWVYVTESNVSKVYVHASRIERRSEGDVRIWVRYIPHGNRGAALYPNNPKSPRYTELVAQNRFSCNDRTMAAITRNFYDANGDVVATEKGNEFLLNPVVPDSIGDALLGVACARAPQIGR